jgi:transposase, IS30 family
MPKGYQQLTKDERDRLSLLRAQGKSLREISGLLSRNVSTISREVKRNSRPFHNDYLPHKAQNFADVRKAAGHERQRLRSFRLRTCVKLMLRNGWSPERISGRLKAQGRESVSHEAIYQWIYADARDMIPFLVRARRRRLRRSQFKKQKRSKIPSRTPISERPASIELRDVPGHWEADTIVGARHKSALRVLVERKSRLTSLRKLPAKNSEAMRESIIKALRRYPRRLRLSITYDNGSENVQHLETNKKLGTVSYFCAPMHSWEKGSVENAAGLVRRRLPKQTDFAMVTERQVKSTESWLNNMPRKCLGYKTPREVFRESVALAG